MKKILFGLLAAALIMANGLHASADKDQKTQEEPKKNDTTRLVINSDELNNPEEFLKKIQEKPEYVNAQVMSDKTPDQESLISALTDKYLLEHPALNYDPLIRFVISKTAPQELQQHVVELTVIWATKNRPLFQVSGCIDFLIENGINAQIMLFILEKYLEKSSAKKIDKDDHEKIVHAIEKLQTLIAKNSAKKELEAASKEVAPKTFPQIHELLKPSNPHLLAIKHAIEDMTEDDDFNQRNSRLNALMRALRDEGDWLELRDETGYTPFLYAAYLGKQETMRYLIRRGANINAKTKDGADALYFEPEDKKGEYQKLITEERLEREKQIASQKERAKEIEERYSQALFKRLKEIDLPIQEQVPSLVFYAIMPETINLKNHEGRTALIEAAILGRIEFTKTLLNKGADTALTDTEGNTALHRAINEGHYNIANLLVPTMDKQTLQKKNKDKFTAYDLAMKQEDRNKDNVEFQTLVKTMKAKMQ